MEILVTNELIFRYWGMMVVLILFGLLLAFLSISLIIEAIKSFDSVYIPFGILLLIAGALAGSGLYDLWNKGATVQYKAKITDFNEVYNGGYEIVGQEGKLYIIEEKK